MQLKPLFKKSILSGFSRYQLYSLFTYLVISLSLFMKERPTASGDTEAYVDQAKAGLFSAHLWINHVKPPLTAFLLKICNGNWEAFTWLQFIIYLVSVLILAHAFLKFLYKVIQAPLWLANLGHFFILGMSLSIDLFFWNRVILSESITISGFFLLNAGVLYLFLHFYSSTREGFQKVGKFPVSYLLLGIGILLFSLSRDANIYQLLGSVGLVLIFGILFFRKMELRKFVVTLSPWVALIVSLFILNTLASNYHSRWARPLVRLFYDRVLYLENDTRFYVGTGMPRPSYLSSEGLWSAPSGEAVRLFADSPSFNQWLETEGKKAFTRWIFSDPLRFWKEVFSGEILKQSLNQTLLGYTEASPPQIIYTLSDTLFFPKSKTAALWALIVFICFVLAFRSGIHRVFWIYPLVSYLSIPPLIFLNHHTCGIELSRHTLIQSLQFRMMMWVVLFVSVGMLLALRQNPRKPTSL